MAPAAPQGRPARGAFICGDFADLIPDTIPVYIQPGVLAHQTWVLQAHVPETNGLYGIIAEFFLPACGMGYGLEPSGNGLFGDQAYCRSCVQQMDKRSPLHNYLF